MGMKSLELRRVFWIIAYLIGTVDLALRWSNGIKIHGTFSFGDSSGFKG